MTAPDLSEARRWYNALAPESRPNWDDVETVVRMGVRTPDVVRRMLWHDPATLMPHLDALRSLLDGKGTTEMAPPSESPIHTKVRAWLEGLLLGESVSSQLVEEVIEEASAAPLRGLLPREVLRMHSGELETILGGRPPAEQRAPTHMTEDQTDVTSDVPPSTDFAPFTPSSFGGPAQRQVRFARSEDGGIRLSWDAPVVQAGVRIFRVTALDEYVPISPDESRLVGVTRESSVVDAARFATAKRHFAVWMNEGADEREALVSQPVKFAQGTCVLPVRDLHLSVVDSQVSGTWTTADGVEGVEVHRLPASEADSDVYDARYLIEEGDAGQFLRGFQHHTEPGQWVYRVYAFADHQGERIRSPLVSQSVLVEAVLPKVTDLRVSPDRDDSSLCTLSWPRPEVHNVAVVIHRHTEPLQASIVSRVLDAEAVKRFGLTEATMVNQPPVEIDGRMVLEKVRWPALAPRIHFTPVTKSEDGSKFQVGESHTLNRAGAVTGARVVERVDEQFLTFGWPEGADFVRVFQGARGVDVDDVNTLALVADLSHLDYQRFGGARLTNTLPPDGCALHLVGISFLNGRPSAGPVRSVDYPGLVRIRYSLVRPMAVETKRGLFGRRSPEPAPQPLRLSVRSELTVDSLRLALVHHARRLPLHPGDGQRLLEGEVALPQGQEVILKDNLSEVEGKRGFVRLFAVVPEPELSRYAVLDPPIEQLRCQ